MRGMTSPRADPRDPKAVRALVLEHQEAIYRYCRSLTRSDDLAEDVLQETFLAALRAPADIEVASPRAWLCTIARNTAFRLGKRRAGEPEHFESLAELGSEAGWGSEDTPERAAIASQSREALSAAIESLSGFDQEILILRDLEELSVKETAAVMEISEAAVRTRLHRARLRLMKQLRKESTNET
ncbi:MAG: RNA polymerase sigma factor [Myxococcota bacterium]